MYDAEYDAERGATIIRSTFANLDEKFTSPKAAVELMAIGLQESRFLYRKQLGDGPAHGFWQNERGGGIVGVIIGPATRTEARALCARLGVEFTASAVYEAIVYNDELACAWARLILWADPLALPEIGDIDAAWKYYIRNWRPGKPKPITWTKLYKIAVETLHA